MQLLNEIGQIIWVFTLMTFTIFMIGLILSAGVFIIAKLIKFIKDDL